MVRNGARFDLSWTGDCGSGTSYGICRGDATLGYTSLAVHSCSTFGTTATISDAPAHAEFFLVVPNDGVTEGSYDLHSDGERRPQAPVACLPWFSIDTCAP